MYRLLTVGIALSLVVTTSLATDYFGGVTHRAFSATETNDNLSQGAQLVVHGKETNAGAAVLQLNPTSGVALTFSQQDINNDSAQIRINSDSSAGGQVTLTGNVVVSLTRGGASIVNGQAQIDSSGTGVGPWTDNGFAAGSSGKLNLNGQTITFTVGAATHDGTNALDPGVDLLISALVQNGGIIKEGAGIMFLSNAGTGPVTNTYAGGTTINGGTLQIDADSSLGNSSGVNTINAGTLEVTQTISTSRNFTLGNAASGIAVDNSKNFSVFGNLTGAGALNKLGFGTLILVGTNAYLGGTKINAGNLSFAIGGLAAGTITFTGNATLLWSNFNGTNTTDITSGSYSLAINNGATATFNTSGNNITFASSFGGTGSGAVTKSGLGTLNITAANSYTGGTNISQGTLSFVNGGLGSVGAITFTGTSTLQWNGSNTQDISSRLALSNGVTASLDTNGNNVSFASAIGGTSSTGTTIQKTGSGTLATSFTSTFLGAITVSAGTLQVTPVSGTAVANAKSITVTGTNLLGTASVATLAGSGTVGSATLTTVGASVSSVGLVNPGVGTSNGILILSGGLKIIDGQIALNMSQALTNSAGFLAQFNGTTATDAAAYYAANQASLASWTAAPTSTQSDYIVVNGQLDLAARSAAGFGSGTVQLIDNGYLANAVAGDVLHLMDFSSVTSGITGTFQAVSDPTHPFVAGGTVIGDLDLPSLPSGLLWDTSLFQSQGILVVVPEPGRAVLFMLGLGILFFRRRRP